MKFKIALSSLFQKIQSTNFYQFVRHYRLFEFLLIKPIEKLKILTREIDDNTLLKIIASEKPLIIEIGADQGQDTVKLASLFPDSTIYSFEPDPRNIPLVDSAIKNFKNVTLITKAVSNTNTKAIFHLSTADEGGEGSSSLREPYLATKVHKKIRFEETHEVECVSLDYFCNFNKISKIDFIWMDVQGAEDLVFEGAKEILQKTKYIYTEYSNIELYKGQVGIELLLSTLPSFRVKKIYTSNVLFENTQI